MISWSPGNTDIRACRPSREPLNVGCGHSLPVTPPGEAHTLAYVAKAKDNKKPDNAPRIVNRRASFDYHIDERLECGIKLHGTEIKQLRLGQAQVVDAFARIDKGELFLYGIHIDPYTHAGQFANHVPKRPRKLLAHKREIAKLDRLTQERGVTLIPTVIYFKDGRAKVEIGVARGKKQHDKRADLKAKASDREIRRAMSTRQ